MWGLQNIRHGTAQHTSLLSADHRATFAHFAGEFTPPHPCTSGPPISVSASTGTPVRAKMSLPVQAAYAQSLPHDTLQKLAVDLTNGTNAWPTISRALDILGLTIPFQPHDLTLPLYVTECSLSISSSQHALSQYADMPPDTQVDLLRGMKTQAHIATSTYLEKITPILHASDTAARQLAKSPHSAKTDIMTPHLGSLFETLQKWKTASQMPDCPHRSSILENIARDMATRYLIPRTPQQPCTYHAWVQWGDTLQSHATMHLAQCGLHYVDGVWGPDGPSQPDARKRQSQKLEDILRCGSDDRCFQRGNICFAL
jgi:hypothetical protein